MMEMISLSAVFEKNKKRAGIIPMLFFIVKNKPEPHHRTVSGEEVPQDCEDNILYQLTKIKKPH